MLVLFRFKHHPPPTTPAHPTEVVRALSPPPTPCQVSCRPQRGPPHPRGVAVAWPVTGIREIRRYLAVVGPLVFELCVWGVGGRGGGRVTSRMARGPRCHPYRRTAVVQASSMHSLESCSLITYRNSAASTVIQVKSSVNPHLPHIPGVEVVDHYDSAFKWSSR